MAPAINQIATIGRLRPGTIRLVVRPQIGPEEIHAALDRVLNLHGCPKCGFNGLSLLFQREDPLQAAFNEFQNIASVEQFV